MEEIKEETTEVKQSETDRKLNRLKEIAGNVAGKVAGTVVDYAKEKKAEYKELKTAEKKAFKQELKIATVEAARKRAREKVSKKHSSAKDYAFTGLKINPALTQRKPGGDSKDGRI